MMKRAFLSICHRRLYRYHLLDVVSYNTTQNGGRSLSRISDVMHDFVQALPWRVTANWYCIIAWQILNTMPLPPRDTPSLYHTRFRCAENASGCTPRLELQSGLIDIDLLTLIYAARQIMGIIGLTCILKLPAFIYSRHAMASAGTAATAFAIASKEIRAHFLGRILSFTPLLLCQYLYRTDRGWASIFAEYILFCPWFSFTPFIGTFMHFGLYCYHSLTLPSRTPGFLDDNTSKRIPEEYIISITAILILKVSMYAQINTDVIIYAKYHHRANARILSVSE